MTRSTSKQGHYLAFIQAYTKLNKRPLAETDMQRYFSTAPPTVHRMVVELKARGFVTRIPGAARSITLLIEPAQLPPLE